MYIDIDALSATDLLLQLRFIHCTIVSPFTLHHFSFSLTNQQRGEKSLKGCWWIIITAYIYPITLMAKYTCTWLHHPLKLLVHTMFLPCTNSNQAGWLHVETHRCVLGLWFANTATAKIIRSRGYDDRSFSPCTESCVIKNEYVTFYAWTNWLTVSVIYQHTQLLLCVNTLLSSTWQQTYN